MFYSYENCRIILDKSDDYNTLTNPLVINWNINGQCQNNCKYCFSKDYVNIPARISKLQLDNIITQIKTLSPLLVVISGGEPLLFPEIKYVIDSIMKFSHVILDTNGFCLDEEFILYCKSNKVLLRVSLDDYRSHINDNIRKSSIINSTELVLDKINTMLDLYINFIIHSVLSDDNIDYIIEYGEYLLSIGVRFWEIQVVIPYIGDKENLNRKLIELNNFYQSVKSHMCIKIHKNSENENGIILINPKGEFLTRKTNSLKKELIDPQNCCNPSLDTLISVLDMKNHFKRYTDNIV